MNKYKKIAMKSLKYGTGMNVEININTNSSNITGTV